jgi:hypothetical protein
MYLPEVMKRMSEFLDYYWMFALIHSGNKQLINGRKLFCGWKPILIFQNGFKLQENELFEDIIMGSGKEKNDHKWQQAKDELNYLITNFTNTGDLVCDPFSGSGTTLIALKELNRIPLGAEIDETEYNIAKNRINELF